MGRDPLRTRLTANPSSRQDFERIVNTPTRGIGDKTTELLREVGESANLEGAILVPLSWLREESRGDAFGKRLAEKLPAKKTLYLHCRSGKRVLITAETGRALNVLKEKLPAEIQPLCVSVLGQGGDGQGGAQESLQGTCGERGPF